MLNVTSAERIEWRHMTSVEEQPTAVEAEILSASVYLSQSRCLILLSGLQIKFFDLCRSGGPRACECVGVKPSDRLEK